MAQTPTKRSAHSVAPPRSILIVGCGIAGPALASLLLSFPHPVTQLPRITILERSSTFTGFGQNIDIRGVGKPIIRRLGLEAEIRASTTGEEGVRFIDEKDQVWAEFAVDKTGKTERGTSDVEILRGRLAEILFRRSQAISAQVVKQGGPGIEYIFGDTLESLNQDADKAHVRLAKGGSRSFDLVVGADGLQSKTRRLAFGQETSDESVKPLDLYGSFFSMPREDTDGSWRHWFHSPGRMGVMMRPSGRSDKSTVFISLACRDNDNKDLRVDRSSVQTQKSLLINRLRNTKWQQSDRIIRGIEAADDFYFDVLAQVKMEAWSKGRVVLLGDAGYCGSPFSGMGTTLALSGAYHLAGALLSHGEQSTALAAYEQKMRPLVNSAQKLPPGIPHIIHPETAWGVWVMRTIFSVIYHLGLVDLMFKLKSQPVDTVSVEDYGFRSWVL